MRRNVRGRVSADNPRFINAVLWMVRTGSPWRDLPPGYGSWSNTHRRFIRWRDKGIWEKLLEILIDEPDKRESKLMAIDTHGMPVRILVTQC
ncbi:MAG: transposase [Burkholderiales bacterium]|nr:transposase [Burkholderiales bacterium]